MAEHYKVIETQPWTYISETGRTVDGHRVWFTITAHPELVPHFVDVPSLNLQVIKARIEQFIKDINSLLS